MIRRLKDIRQESPAKGIVGLLDLTKEEYDYYLELTGDNFFTSNINKDYLILNDKQYNTALSIERNQMFKNLL